MAERNAAKTRARTGKASKGFTDEERAAMRERAKEVKAAGRRGARADGESDVLEKIAEMARQARFEVSQAKQAFASRDVELAADLVRQDEIVNRLNRECFRLAIEIGDDPDTREWAMHMMLVARWLERIGDNAVDIGEQTAFVVTGLFREFTDASHPELAPPTVT